MISLCRFVDRIDYIAHTGDPTARVTRWWVGRDRPPKRKSPMLRKRLKNAQTPRRRVHVVMGNLYGEQEPIPKNPLRF
jgi:hypothetical protein